MGKCFSKTSTTANPSRNNNPLNFVVNTAADLGATSRGISLKELYRLEARIKREVANGRFKRLDPVTYQPIGDITDYEELTTGDVVHQWAKLAEVTGTERLADCAFLVDLAEIGLPLYFVSHAWKGRFAKLVKAVKAHLRNAPDTTRVWIDCFAVNQHQDTRPAVNAADVASFEATIQQCRGGTIVAVDMALCNPSSRGWCLYEVSKKESIIFLVLSPLFQNSFTRIVPIHLFSLSLCCNYFYSGTRPYCTTASRAS